MYWNKDMCEGCLIIKTRKVDNVNIVCTGIETPLNINAYKISPLNISCNLICYYDFSEPFLIVKDTNVFIPADGSTVYTRVTSNTEWKVVLNEDSEHVSVYYEGVNNGPIYFESGENDDLDIESTGSVKTLDDTISVDLQITHLGLREAFTCNDVDFILNEDTTFNVLKE